jgi:trans-aconitate 2-methyltransferase
MADWDPELYNRFRRYRAEPVEHILSRIKFSDHETIVDLGCGSGENTLDLARRSPHGTAHGIDGSVAMIAAANKLLEDDREDLRRRVSFEVLDVAKFHADRAFTLIFSNATFQWLPNHRALFAACFAALKPGGRIVVQMPANETETAKVELGKLAREDRWRSMLSGRDRAFHEDPPEFYAAMLSELGYDQIDCYHRTFHHPMDKPGDVVQWYQSTGLRPFMDALPKDRHDEFLAALTARLNSAYGTSGPMMFDFKRLFISGSRPRD